jgi:hypothetical protein
MGPTDASYRKLFKSASASSRALFDVGQAWEETLDRSARSEYPNGPAACASPSDSWAGHRHRLAVLAVTINLCALVTFSVVAPAQSRHLLGHSTRPSPRQSSSVRTERSTTTTTGPSVSPVWTPVQTGTTPDQVVFPGSRPGSITEISPGDPVAARATTTTDPAKG